MIYEEIKENHSENAYTVQIFKPVTQLNDALCEHLEKDKSLMQCSTLDHKAWQAQADHFFITLQ